MKTAVNRLRGVEHDIVQMPQVGEVAPYYEPQRNEVAVFEAAYKKRLPVMLKGPTGCGKTRFLEHMPRSPTSTICSTPNSARRR